MNLNNKKYFGVHAIEIYAGDKNTETFVIQQYDGSEFKYWNREKQKWVNGMHEATYWPKDEPNKTPYLANNVYRAHDNFKADNYKLVNIYAGLPQIMKHDLYLHSITPAKNIWCGEDTVLWTSSWKDALLINGLQKGIDVIWELIHAEKTGSKINPEVVQNLSISDTFAVKELEVSYKFK